MSHQIGKFLGRNTIAYFGETPWHKLGQQIPLELVQDIEAVMHLAGLDWDVLKTPLYHVYEAALGNVITQNPYAYGVLRPSDGAILSSVGRDTELVQNREALDIVEPLIKEHGFTIEVAGALGNGSQIWLAAKAPEGFEPIPGDKHDIFFMLRHYHTNGGSTEGTLIDVRPVCANTIGMAIGRIGGEDAETGRAFRIKKTSGVRERIAEAKKLVAALGDTVTKQKETYQRLFEAKLTPEQTADFIAGLFPLDKVQKVDESGKVVYNDLGNAVLVEKESKVIAQRRKTVAELIFTQPGAELAGANVETGEYNAFTVLNAITHYFDHVREAEAKSESAKQAARVSAAFGQNNAAKLLAFSKLRKMALVAA